MVSRPYKCPLCHSAFRNESGMKWHISHRHEIPAAFDALGKDYKAEIANLNQEIVLKNKKAEQLEKELQEVQIALIQEKTEKIKALVRVMELENATRTMMLMIVIRDIYLKQLLNMELPNPFIQK